MREIRFRAWDKKAKRFVLAKWIETNVIPTTRTEYGFKLKSTFILQQYTGLHDRNGREIYEGDIVRYFMDLPMDGEEDKRKSHNLSIVTWSECVPGFAPMSEGPVDFDTIEVIGNIYEHPELLKGAGE